MKRAPQGRRTIAWGGATEGDGTQDGYIEGTPSPEGAQGRAEREERWEGVSRQSTGLSPFPELPSAAPKTSGLQDFKTPLLAARGPSHNRNLLRLERWRRLRRRTPTTEAPRL
jgi:hypothetical protein